MPLVISGVAIYNRCMGNLVNLHMLIKEDALWYFNDAYWDYNRKGYRFEWPSNDYPNLRAIHSEDIGGHYVDIRKWIEHNTCSAVIHEEKNLSYKVYWGESRDWDKTHHISNLWHIFYFDNEEDALAFHLRFVDIIKTVTPDHPYDHYGTRTEY